MAMAKDRFMQTVLEIAGLIVVEAVVIGTKVKYWRRNAVIRGQVDRVPRRRQR